MSLLLDLLASFAGNFLPFAVAAPPTLGAIWWIMRALRRNGLSIGLKDAILWLFHKEARHRVSVSMNIRRYCRMLLRDEKYSRLIVPGRQDGTLDIEKVFVDLRMEETRSDAEEFTNATLLEAGSRIRIVGDPGSGKSCLVRWVLRRACQAALERPTRSRLPILVELKSFPVPPDSVAPEDLGEWALAEIQRYVSNVEGHRMGEFFDRCVRSNRSGVLLLLDGMDEVKTPDCARVIETVNALARRLAGLAESNTVIITMRIQFHEQVRRRFADEFPLTLWVQPFTPADIFEFLTRRFPAKHGVAPTATAIYNELTDRSSLRDMCGNPLMLAMYVANHRDVESISMPDTRTEFYQLVARELLVMRRSRQLSDRDARIAKRTQREAILGRVALENMLDLEQAPNSLSWPRAVEITAGEIDSVPDEAEGVLLDLEVHTGIFAQERQSETFRFIHLTFCEYFAALQAAQYEQDGWHRLIAAQWALQRSPDALAASRLMEVIPFAVALLPKARISEALSDVFALGNMELYGRCLLETQEYGHTEWKRFVKQEYEYFAATESSDWDEQWLRRLHLYQTVVADAELVSRHTRSSGPVSVSLDELFSHLVGDDKTKLIQLFSAYASKDPVAALRLSEACRVDMVTEAPELVAAACETPAFLASAIGYANNGSAPISAWAAVFAEAGMSKRLVALTLAKTPASGRFAQAAKAEQVGGVRLAARFLREPPPAVSLYDVCLALSSSTGNWAGPRVSVLRELGPLPGALRRIQKSNRLTMVGGTIAVPLAAAALTLWGNMTPVQLAAMTTLLMLYATVLVCASWLAARIAIARIVNLPGGGIGTWLNEIDMAITAVLAIFGQQQLARAYLKLIGYVPRDLPLRLDRITRWLLGWR